MPNREKHVSDEELLLAAEDEPGWQGRRVRAHLETCPACCERAARLESTFAEIARAGRSRFDTQLPSAAVPRAQLRTRLAELSAERTGVFARAGFSAGRLARAGGAAALVGVAALICLLAFRYSEAARPSASLLAVESGILPNRALTPGATRPASLAEVCALPHEEVVRAVSPQERRTVLAEYGIPAARSEDYELDYLITPGLGGKDDLRNLWPEPHRAAAWNAETKDVLEERLHEMVCAHQLDLPEAQQAIATDWIGAYRKYVQADPPSAGEVRTPSLAKVVSAMIFQRDPQTLRIAGDL